jgi:hypothetical protein
VTKRIYSALNTVAPWAAWSLTIGGLFTFIGVIIGWVTVGDAKPATLLVSADLFVSGISAVQVDADTDDV